MPQTLRIHFNNCGARVDAPKNVIRDLQHLIAFREQDLPPPPVQGIVKGFMADRRSYGMMADHQRLFDDVTIAQDLVSRGWGPEKLTSRMMQAVMRMRGIWDGWRTLITARGHFGTGLVPHVRRALEMRLGYPVELVDEREKWAPEPMGRTPMPSLYDYQQEAVTAWLKAGRGVIDLPPRSGKTRIAIAAVVALGLPTLIVVPTKELVRQTAARFKEYLHPSDVVEVTGGRPNAKLRRRMNTGLVWIATPPTAAGPKDGKKRHGIEGIRSRKVLVIDEFHHAAADTWRFISEAATEAYYRMGLTGTHFRADGRDLAMHAVLSRSVYSRSVDEMVELGRLVPAKIAMVRVPGDVMGASGHGLYSEGVTDHAYRNGLAKIAVEWLMHMGKRVLVLTKEVEHSRMLAAMIGPRAVQVDGSSSEDIRGHLEDLEANRIGCVVGTSVIGEGVDVPAADALVYVAGGKSPVKHKQDYFRVLTASAGKKHGLIIDFADIHHPTLAESAAHRLGMYRSEAAFTSEVIDSSTIGTWIQREA